MCLLYVGVSEGEEAVGYIYHGGEVADFSAHIGYVGGSAIKDDACGESVFIN